MHSPQSLAILKADPLIKYIIPLKLIKKTLPSTSKKRNTILKTTPLLIINTEPLLFNRYANTKSKQDFPKRRMASSFGAHYKALMKKNYTIWKRNSCGSCCEVNNNRITKNLSKSITIESNYFSYFIWLSLGSCSYSTFSTLHCLQIFTLQRSTYFLLHFSFSLPMSTL